MEDLQGGTLALEHRYDLDARIREYALVTVYRSTQHPFDRPVWVKVCEATGSHSAPAVYDRLKRSIVEAAAFAHDRASKIVDFGDIDTHVAFWVTERRDGTPLDDYLERQGTLSPAEALEIVARVGEVIDAAHAEGLCHGGIAPRWITIDDDGVCVDHFAIQPTMAEIRQLDGVILSHDLLFSLPPEQFGSEAVSHSVAGDVWAMGALLYWMVAGVHPYLEDPTDTSEAVLRLRGAAPAQTLEELGFDPSISDLVATALAADLDERFSSIREFLDAVPVASPSELTLDDEQHVAPPPVEVPHATPHGPRQGGVGTALAAIVVVFILTNLGWFFYTTSQEAGGPAREVESSTPAILPVGVELSTEPPDATILRIDGAQEIEFGDTPLTLDPKALPEGTLPIIVRKRGYRDVRLDVSATDDGHELTVHLPTEGEQAASE